MGGDFILLVQDWYGTGFVLVVGVVAFSPNIVRVWLLNYTPVGHQWCVFFIYLVNGKSSLGYGVK